MPNEANLKTRINAGSEGLQSLLGNFLFYNFTFDAFINKVSHLKTVALNTTLPALTISSVFSFFGGLGAYKCHEAIDRSNQPIDDTIAELLKEASISEIEKESKAASESKDDLKHKNSNELLETISELKTLIAKKDKKLAENNFIFAEIAKVNDAAKVTLLTKVQKWHVFWEWINHGASFIGFLQLAFSLTGGVPPEAEIPVEIACMAVVLYGALAEVATATNAMRLNNARDKLSTNPAQQHGLFKSKTNKIQLADIDLEANTNSTVSVDSDDYQRLDSGTTYPHRLSPASSLSLATL